MNENEQIILKTSVDWEKSDEYATKIVSSTTDAAEIFVETATFYTVSESLKHVPVLKLIPKAGLVKITSMAASYVASKKLAQSTKKELIDDMLEFYNGFKKAFILSENLDEMKQMMQKNREEKKTKKEHT